MTTRTDKTWTVTYRKTVDVTVDVTMPLGVQYEDSDAHAAELLRIARETEHTWEQENTVSEAMWQADPWPSCKHCGEDLDREDGEWLTRFGRDPQCDDSPTGNHARGT